MASPLDRRLDALLAKLSARLGAATEDVIFLGPDDMPEHAEVLANALGQAGLLKPAVPASSVICDGCERSCAMPIELVGGRQGKGAKAFVVCTERDDIGRVPIAPERLQRWSLSRCDIALTLAKVLGTGEPPIELDRGRVWRLGSIKLGRTLAEVMLSPNPEALPPGPHLGIVLLDSGDRAARHCMAVGRAVTFSGGKLVPQTKALRAALENRIDDQTVACEIRFAGGEIVLINHATSCRRTVGSPNFNSANDNVFGVLYANPGKRFSLGELRAEAREPMIGDLHKIVENLGFDSMLRRVFFRVSKAAICFTPTVTMGQLATLGIDPRAIS